jgi:DNA repair photolyase
VYGVDLTAGCAHACVYCPVQVSGLGPNGERRLPFDPYTAEALKTALDNLEAPAQTIVLSPLSDPLPPLRMVRAEAVRVARVVLERGLNLLVLTRGRIPRRMVDLLAAHPAQSKVAIGIFSLNKQIVRPLEPLAASPLGRVRDVERLTLAGVPVEIRLEPLVPGLTDTRENLVPLFRRLRDAGATRIVAHYLFQHPTTWSATAAVLAQLGCDEAVIAGFETGPQVHVGSMGTVRNVPRDLRQEGLARAMAYAAEFGLTVVTGATQNPDLPRVAGESDRASQRLAAGRNAPQPVGVG